MDNLTDIQLADLLGGDEQTAQARSAALAAALRKQQAMGQDQQAMAGLAGYFNAPGATAMGKAYGDIGAAQYEQAGRQLEAIPKVVEQRLQRALQAQQQTQQATHQDRTATEAERSNRAGEGLKRQQLAQGKFGSIAPGGQVMNLETGELGGLGPAKPPTAGSGEPLAFKNSMALRKEFAGLPEVKNFKEVSDAFGKVKGATDDANPAPAADMSLIFSYMKMMDPGSTVREGEYASAQNTTGAAGKLINLYNKSLSGNFLSPQQRKDFRGEAEKLFKVHKGARDKAANQYRTLAEKNGLAADDVTGAMDAPVLDDQAGTLSPERQARLAELRAKKKAGALK